MLLAAIGAPFPGKRVAVSSPAHIMRDAPSSFMDRLLAALDAALLDSQTQLILVFAVQKRYRKLDLC